MRTGEWVVAANWRRCSIAVVRGVAGEPEDELRRPARYFVHLL